MVQFCLIKKKNILKIATVTALATVGWSFAVHIHGLFESNSTLGHLVFEVIVSVSTLILFTVLYKFENIKGKTDFNLSKHLRSFGAGFLWFFVPATALLLGTTSIGFHLACMTFQQSFTERWEIFAVSNEAMLQMYIFGMIPLSIVSAFFVIKMLDSKT